MDRHVLQSEIDSARLQRGPCVLIELTSQQWLDGAKQRDAHERDNLGFVAANLPLERLPAIDVVSRPEVANSWARARDQVGDPEPELRQPDVIEMSDRFAYEAGVGQQLPEPVRVPGEMMSRFRRPDTRVDADEKHAHARRDAVLQAKVGPIHMLGVIRLLIADC